MKKEVEKKEYVAPTAEVKDVFVEKDLLQDDNTIEASNTTVDPGMGDAGPDW